MSFRSRKPPSTSAPCSPVSSTTPSRRRSKASQGLKGRGFQHTTSFRAVTDALRRSCRFYRCWRSASALGRCGRSWNSSQSTWSWRQGALGRVFAWAAIYANEEFARRAVSALATEVETYLRLQPAGPSSWDFKKPLIISNLPENLFRRITTPALQNLLALQQDALSVALSEVESKWEALAKGFKVRLR